LYIAGGRPCGNWRCGRATGHSRWGYISRQPPWGE
jgi:hypothetical protein